MGACIIIETSSTEITEDSFVNSMALLKGVIEIKWKKRSVSNLMNEKISFWSIFSNYSVVEIPLLHWLTFASPITRWLSLSKTDLLILLIFDFEGLFNRHDLLGNPGLWSCSVMKDSFFSILSILLSSESFSSDFLQQKLILLSFSFLVFYMFS